MISLRSNGMTPGKLRNWSKSQVLKGGDASSTQARNTYSLPGHNKSAKTRLQVKAENYVGGIRSYLA